MTYVGHLYPQWWSRSVGRLYNSPNYNFILFNFEFITLSADDQMVI